MFDDVMCELPMPGDPQPKHLIFQTKDFECYMDTYTIKSDGTLWRSRSEGRDEQVPFHGLLDFYTFESDPKDQGRGPGLWFQYEAKFTDGKCVGIECVEIRRSNFGGPDEMIYERSSQSR